MKARRLTWLLVGLLGALVLVGSALAMSSTNYRLDWFVLLNSGGGGPASSTNYAANLTVGQTAIYASSSTNYRTHLGYWFGDADPDAGPERYAIYIPLALRGYSHIAYAPACGSANNYCEDYDSPETAYGPLEPGQAYQAYPNDEKDYYYFLVLNPASITVRVTNYQAVGQLIVRQEDLTAIGQDVEDPISDGILQVTLDLSPGKYYIQIYTTSGANQDHLYTLDIN